MKISAKSKGDGVLWNWHTDIMVKLRKSGIADCTQISIFTKEGNIDSNAPLTD